MPALQTLDVPNILIPKDQRVIAAIAAPLALPLNSDINPFQLQKWSFCLRENYSSRNWTW